MLDRKVAINTSAANVQRMKSEELVPGMYRINISWKSEEVNFFQQEKIFIQ